MSSVASYIAIRNAQRQNDERFAEYWNRLIIPQGWMTHMSDEVVPGRDLPYAAAMIEVKHVQGSACFIGPAEDTAALSANSVIVFGNEIKPATRPAPPNRQSDGNTYIYTLSPSEHYFSDTTTDFNSLPTRKYRLEIMIPLFHIEPVVHRYNNAQDGYYWVRTANSHIYESDELEEKDGAMGIWSSSTTPSREFVWKLPRKAENIDAFTVHMHSRTTALRKARSGSRLRLQRPGGAVVPDLKRERDETGEDDNDDDAATEPAGKLPRTMARRRILPACY